MRKKIKADSVRSILLITLSNIGDIILTTPVFEELSANFPQASFDIVSGPSGYDIFEGHPKVSKVINLKDRKGALGRLLKITSLRSKKYDVIVDLKGTLVTFFLRGNLKPGVSAITGTIIAKNKRPIHKVEEHLLKVRFLGINSMAPRFLNVDNMVDVKKVEELIGKNSGKKRILICPGSKSHLKRWDHGKFAELSDMIADIFDADIIFGGDDSDREIIAEIISTMGNDAVDLSGRTTINELIKIMGFVDIVITNDSAPLHMASSANVPTVAIFGPTDELKYGPLSDRNKVVKPNVECRPCNKALCGTGPDEGCIADIEVDAVFDAVKELLESRDAWGGSRA